MGQKAQEPIEITVEDLPTYLRANHSVFMDLGGKSYYLTDVNDHFWRVQDTETLNDKGHFVDLTEPVSTVGEFLEMPGPYNLLRHVFDAGLPRAAAICPGGRRDGPCRPPV